LASSAAQDFTKDLVPEDQLDSRLFLVIFLSYTKRFLNDKILSQFGHIMSENINSWMLLLQILIQTWDKWSKRLSKNTSWGYIKFRHVFLSNKYPWFLV